MSENDDNRIAKLVKLIYYDSNDVRYNDYNIGD